MPRLLTLAVLLVLGPAAAAQAGLAFPLDGLAPEVIAEHDARHRSAVHADPAQAVFADREGEVAEAWNALLGALSAHLQAEGFDWAEPLRTYHRFYFHPDGTIARVLYHLRDAPPDRAAEYGDALDAFAADYRFALTADEGFAQCSPATLLPPSSTD